MASSLLVVRAAFSFPRQEMPAEITFSSEDRPETRTHRRCIETF